MVQKGCSVFLILIFFVLESCSSVGPDYHKPEFSFPSFWKAKTGKRIRIVKKLDDRVLGSWWKVLNDPVLIQLEKEALQNNLDVKIAVSRISEARAAVGFEKARLYPVLDADGKYSRRRSGMSREESDFFSLALNSSWELDIFGGTRRSVEAALANLEALEAGLQDVLVTLTADVALSYISFRTYEARIAVAKNNIRIQQETYELNESRYKAGLADELIVQQALYNLERTRSFVPTLEAGLERARNRIAVLLGKTPEEIDKMLLPPGGQLPEVPISIAVGIPADVIRRRPDIRKAEKELHAATASIGVAVSDLYPKFHLIGSIGLESLHTSELLEWSSRLWQIGPGITWKIFDAGSIRQNIDIQTERQKQAFLRYKASILRALEEVENALVAFEKEQIRRESLLKAVAAAVRSEQLARDRYDAGLVDFVTVLDAQRARQALQDDLVLSSGAVISNLVRLYRALGGGWENWRMPAPTSD